MSIQNFIDELTANLKEVANNENRISMEVYMKNHFEFFGIRSPLRKAIYKNWKPCIKNCSPEEKLELINELWKKPQREFQYIGVDLLNSRRKNEWTLNDIHTLEFFITEKSWWDTVDLIASNAVGTYFKLYPKQIERIIPQWIYSQNLWLQRSSLIFQLKYKEDTDFELLKNTIVTLNHNKDFFIQKAIGWSLRQYSKYHPLEVRHFIQEIKLEGLALKEAQKFIQ